MDLDVELRQLTCDAVIELDATLRLVEHSDDLAAILLHGEKLVSAASEYTGSKRCKCARGSVPDCRWQARSLKTCWPALCLGFSFCPVPRAFFPDFKEERRAALQLLRQPRTSKLPLAQKHLLGMIEALPSRLRTLCTWSSQELLIKQFCCLCQAELKVFEHCGASVSDAPRGQLRQQVQL